MLVIIFEAQYCFAIQTLFGYTNIAAWGWHIFVGSFIQLQQHNIITKVRETKIWKINWWMIWNKKGSKNILWHRFTSILELEQKQKSKGFRKFNRRFNIPDEKNDKLLLSWINFHRLDVAGWRIPIKSNICKLTTVCVYSGRAEGSPAVGDQSPLQSD